VVLEPEEAKKRFPMFHFADCKEVLWDRTGGVIAANRTLRALLKICEKRGVELKDQTPVLNIEGGYTIIVETPEGKLGADHLILCAGPWSQRLLQCMALWFPLTPVRQTVGYWKPDLPRFDGPHFPTWVHLGKEGLHYGLPAFLPEQPGIKAAFHRTSGKEDDPDAAAAPADLRPVASFLAEQLSVTLGEPLGAENCFYTNTPTEDFYLLRHPMYHNISIGAGFSGHGFKFGPLIGQILAALAHGKATGVPAFDRDTYRFSPLDLL
jgi:glycine/D-amino acid oxidase-like deaminating enzyme